ncbi:MAG: hypothetical protein ACI9XZ_004136, partial [Alphaproteobacteria bacterium]
SRAPPRRKRRALFIGLPGAGLSGGTLSKVVLKRVA